MDHQRTLGRVPSESRLAPEHRVFVNRNLRMGSIGAIGFDLDHTLAHYRGPAVEELAYRLASRRLVERGYPEELLAAAYDRRFVIRGLVIDKRRGNILKMDYHNYVARGYHGFRQLRPEERKAAYRSGRVRMSSEAYVTVDTLFHLPEVYLYVVLVDLLEKQGKKRSYTKLYQHVRESIDSVHGDHSLKREILADLGKFVRKDHRLGETLEEMRRVGKKLFLLTNSEGYYTDAVLSFLLDREGEEPRDWRDLFDVIIVDAAKPGFFTAPEGERKPRKVEMEGTDTQAFSGGNARFLEREIGFGGDQILYFGDHTYGDILRSKKNLGWRTAMVVEELQEELAVSRSLVPQLEELSHWKALRSVLESDVSSLEMEIRKVERRIDSANGKGEGAGKLARRRESLELRREEVVTELKQVKRMTSDLGERVNKTYNPYWGPIFREGQETSRFGHQVKDFACLYMTSVSNILHYTPHHYFRSAVERMPHEIA